MHINLNAMGTRMKRRRNIYDSLALCNKKDLPLIQDIVENFVSKRE